MRELVVLLVGVLSLGCSKSAPLDSRTTDTATADSGAQDANTNPPAYGHILYLNFSGGAIDHGNEDNAPANVSALGPAVLPAFQAWWARIKARPSYAAAFYSPSRISERYKTHFKTAAQLREERGY